MLVLGFYLTYHHKLLINGQLFNTMTKLLILASHFWYFVLLTLSSCICDVCTFDPSVTSELGLCTLVLKQRPSYLL